MAVDTKDLSDTAATEALCKVAREWIKNYGLEVYQVYYQIREVTSDKFQKLPAWVKGSPEEVTDESGQFARDMLTALRNGVDDEVQEWTDSAIQKVNESKAHVLDPLTLGIGGLILIGAILAARVKKIGPVKFYEGIPDNLADVLKAGASVSPVND
jgi:hypothetical protein